MVHRSSLLVLTLTVGACLWSGAGFAQEFGVPGQVVLGAERLTGVYSDHMKSTANTTQVDSNGNTVSEKNEDSTDSTSISLFGMTSVIDDSGITLPSATPRLALDVFVLPGFSVGGSFVYTQRSGSENNKYTPDVNSDSKKQDTPTGSTVMFSPRIGYAAQVSPMFAIWPRAGITYVNYRMTQKSTTSNGTTTITYESKISADFTDVTLELMAVALAVPHFAILVGPYVDLPLGGGVKTTVNGVHQPNMPSLSYWSVGLSAGVAGYF